MPAHDSHIRIAETSDLAGIMSVLDAAKGIMRANGNMNQWVNGYPSEEVIADDIAKGHGFVVTENEGTIVGYFAFIPSPEHTYAQIYDGEWLDDTLPYQVVHRIGSRPEVRLLLLRHHLSCFRRRTARLSEARLSSILPALQANSALRSLFSARNPDTILSPCCFRGFVP